MAYWRCDKCCDRVLQSQVTSMTHDADSLEFAAEARNGGAHRYDPDVQLIVHELSTYAGTTDEVMGPILEEWS